MVGGGTEVNNVTLIQNHDVYSKVIMYDLMHGSIIEIEKDSNFDESKLAKGFYVNINELFVGVVATKNGPLFFVDDNRINLQEKYVTIKVEPIGETNHAFVIEDGSILYEFIYPKIIGVGINAYADEEFLDFFMWLESSTKSQNFNDFYTD